jgi:hypothetical protein
LGDDSLSPKFGARPRLKIKRGIFFTLLKIVEASLANGFQVFETDFQSLGKLL